jgi:hypothetical protein
MSIGRIMRCVRCNDIYLDHYTEESAISDSMFSPCCRSEDRYRLSYGEIQDELQRSAVHTVDQLKTTLYEEGKVAWQFYGLGRPPTPNKEAV